MGEPAKGASLAVVRMLGARALAALMASERVELGRERASSRCASAPDPGVCVSATQAPGRTLQVERNLPSLRESEAGSRVSHSQITRDDQPAVRSAFNAALSRTRLRSILARQ